MPESPYHHLAVEFWEAKTKELIKNHPIDVKELHEIVLQAWRDIFNSQIGSKPFRIGRELLPQPQIMGYFLHELIPLELAYRYPDVWKRGQLANEYSPYPKCPIFY